MSVQFKTFVFTNLLLIKVFISTVVLDICVCVCVCVRERERERFIDIFLFFKT